MQRVLSLWKEAAPIGTSDAYILGERFPLDFTDPESPAFSAEFRQSARNVLYLTYRTQFTPILRDKDGPSPMAANLNAFFRAGPSGINEMDAFTNDVGWGCMIRTGQSLLANALVRLGNDPVKVLWGFRDEEDAPYSLHRFVAYGAKSCSKRPGEWFGPSAVAACIAEFNSGKLNTYVFQGSDIYASQVREFPALILCNLRLGINGVNPIYFRGLRALLQNKFSVGIAGGRTSASHYFYGVQDSQLFFHDPHTPRPAITSQTTEEGLLNQDATLRTLQFEDMDPSMLVGFLVKTAAEFEEFTQILGEVSERERAIHVQDQMPVVDLESEEDGGFVEFHEREGLE